MSLTDDQANGFLAKKLEITDWKSKLEASKFDLFIEINEQCKRSLFYEVTYTDINLKIWQFLTR